MLKLYNTLSRKKETFVPICDEVKMYSCGPTVYSFAHIGNMRAYIFMDSIRRVVKYNGFKIKGMMNITDVGHLMSDSDDGEDKIEKVAKNLKKSPFEIAEEYADAFINDAKKINIDLPEIIEKATDHIQDMLDFVVRLMEKGFAYETSDGIYFDTSKFKDYGKLSKQDLDMQIAGARVQINEEKRNSADFALWKKAPKEHIMQWNSPFGKGFPGWHIECSALSYKFLGEKFDIHTGGIDHIPIHHENEIAQSEALTGEKCVNYWIHNEFMQFEGGKMSKSLNNTYTVSELEEKGYNPLSFRYFCLNTHYRKPLNFSFTSLDGSQTAFLRLKGLVQKHKIGQNVTDKNVIDEYKNRFLEAVNDDINIPLAIGVVWDLLKLEFSKNIYDLVIDFDRVLGLDLDKEIEEENKENNIPQAILDLAQKRLEARKNKDFKKADELRNKIIDSGYSVEDTSDGFNIKKCD